MLNCNNHNKVAHVDQFHDTVWVDWSWNCAQLLDSQYHAKGDKNLESD